MEGGGRICFGGGKGGRSAERVKECGEEVRCFFCGGDVSLCETEVDFGA